MVAFGPWGVPAPPWVVWESTPSQDKCNFELSSIIFKICAKLVVWKLPFLKKCIYLLEKQEEGKDWKGFILCLQVFPSTPLLTHSCGWLGQTYLGQLKSGVRNSICVSHMRGRGPSTRGIICCFLRCISRKLYQEWNSWLSNWPFSIGPWHCKW